MGALFKASFSREKNIKEKIDKLKKNGYNLCAAALDERSVNLLDIDTGEKTCFVIGNEGHGLSGDIIDACDKSVIIPISEKSESLNAAIAASVLMWEIKRKSNG